MKGKILKTLVLVGVLTLVVGAGQAWAQTLTVTAQVGRHCQLGAGTLEFGDYDVLAAAEDTATGTFQVRCTRAATPAQIGLDNGGNFLGGTRRMISGTQFLNYSLWRDVARTLAWTTADRVSVDGTTNAWQTLTVYGSIPANQDMEADLSFTDTVNITVVF